MADLQPKMELADQQAAALGWAAPMGHLAVRRHLVDLVLADPTTDRYLVHRWVGQTVAHLVDRWVDRRQKVGHLVDRWVRHRRQMVVKVPLPLRDRRSSRGSCHQAWGSSHPHSSPAW
jgi:hypothetical protein